MKGQTTIETIKQAPLCWKKKANELIDRANIDWLVDMPDPQFGDASFAGGDTEVRLDLTQLSVIQLGACLTDGTKVTVNVIGYIVPEPAP